MLEAPFFCAAKVCQRTSIIRYTVYRPLSVVRSLLSIKKPNDLHKQFSGQARLPCDYNLLLTLIKSMKKNLLEKLCTLSLICCQLSIVCCPP